MIPKPRWQATAGLALAAMILSMFTPLMSEPTHPAWWGIRGVTSTNNAENLAVANIGQLKHIANQAHEELEALIPTGDPAPFPITDIPASPTPAWYETQHKALNLGQLKAVAQPLYDRLNAISTDWVKAQLETNGLVLNTSYFQAANGHYYPWNPSTLPAENYKAATVGQLKLVYALRFDVSDDTDTVSDLFEISTLGNTDSVFTPAQAQQLATLGLGSALIDSDNDGLSNLAEIFLGTDLFSEDTDGDRVIDGREVELGYDPKSDQSFPPRIVATSRDAELPGGTISHWLPQQNGVLPYTTIGGAYNSINTVTWPALLPNNPESAEGYGVYVNNEDAWSLFFEPINPLQNPPRAKITDYEGGIYLNDLETDGSIDHTRFWLQSKPAATQDFEYQFLKITRQYTDDGQGNPTLVGENVEVVSLALTAGQTLSAAVDLAPSPTKLPVGQNSDRWVNQHLLPVEVVELAPLLTTEDDVAIFGSQRPEPQPRASAMVERNPLAATPITNANDVRIAWRDVKVKIGKALAGETVTWSMEPLHIPGIGSDNPNIFNLPPTFVGNWGTAVNADHRSRFSVSEAFDENDFASGDPQLENATGVNVSQTATTTVDEDGFTSIRVNLPPYGFNKARISIEIKEVSINLIDLEVPGVIVLDAGHGTGAGTINGSNAIGTTARISRAEEHVVARDITNSLVDYMRDEFETDRHLKVFATRSGAANVGFSDRTSVARDQGADVFISVHFNDPGVASITNRRHPFYLVDNTNNVNRNEDIQLGTDVRVAVQAAITAAESQQGIAAPTDGLTSQQHETNLNRLNIDGKDVLTDADEVNRRGTPREYTVTGLGNEVVYHPCRAAIIELEWFSNPAADALFNRNNTQNINGIPGRSAEIRTQLQQFMPNSLFNNILNHQ